MKDIALHILDLVQNSISAGSMLTEIKIEENPSENFLKLTIKDNGKGMPPEILANVKDPYTTTRTTRKVGMGIPFLYQNTEAAAGHLEIESDQGVGTELRAFFCYDHIDRLPLGDLAGVVVMTVSMNPDKDFIYIHQTPQGVYVFDTREVKEALEEVSIQEITIQKYLKEMIEENLNDIGVGGRFAKSK